MGDWDDDWENSAVTIQQAENHIGKEDAIDTEALEKKAKEEIKKKAEEEAKKKKEEEEAKAAKSKKKGTTNMAYTDQFGIPDNKKAQLMKEKGKKDAINDMFDGATHEFNEHLEKIELEEAEDFQILGSLLGNKLCDPDYFLVNVEEFFKNLLDSTYEKLTSKELQEILSKTTVLLQKKQKEEKGAGQKNKKGKGPTVVAAKNTAKYNQGSDSERSFSDEDIGYKANFNEDDFI